MATSSLSSGAGPRAARVTLLRVLFIVHLHFFTTLSGYIFFPTYCTTPRESPLVLLIFIDELEPPREGFHWAYQKFPLPSPTPGWNAN